MSLQRRDLLTYAGATALAAAASSPVLGADGACCPPRADDLWFINTRAVPCGRLSEAHNRTWSAHRMAAGNVWRPSSIEQFFADCGDGRMTVFFVHGHRVNQHWAMESGWWVYQGIVQSCRDCPPPIRYVIWKWPTEGGGRPIPDAREKAVRANYESYRLAWFLAHIPPQSPLSFVGFSLGPRVFTGALHLLAGGVLHGQTVPVASTPQARSVLWAAGLHNHWLMPGQKHGRAMYATDAMLNLYNCCDPVLRFYPRIDPCSQADALGYTGMSASRLGAHAFRYRQRNVCGEVNKLHLTRNYACNASIMASTRQYLLWHPV